MSKSTPCHSEQLSFLFSFFEDAAEQTPGVYDDPCYGDPEKPENPDPPTGVQQESGASSHVEPPSTGYGAARKNSLLEMFCGDRMLARYWEEKHEEKSYSPYLF